jgi:hypothetical protein
VSRQPASSFRQTARFALVTRATIRAGDLPGAEQYADVVLVNLSQTNDARTAGSMSQRRWPRGALSLSLRGAVRRTKATPTSSKLAARISAAGTNHPADS